MNRTSPSRTRRVRALALIAGVAALGFALAALGVLVVHLAADQPLPWAAIVVYLLVAIVTVGVVALVGWAVFPPDPLENLPADSAESAFDVQRRLLDDVRHELKTPITIVRGHLEMMDPRDPEDAAQTRELGMAELDRMTRLIGDIDLLAAVETDKLSFGEVDLAELTRRVGELVAVIPGHEWSIEHTADAVVRGDGDRLLQAWLQLADNAAKYTPAGSPIQLGSAVHAAGAQLWVRDHGPGIPPAMRHRIFRRFDRGAGKRTVGGSGLGLAIVDTIAKAHRGHCAIGDTPGGGATFTIEIPIGTRAELPSPVRAGDVLLQREATG
ncbi:sensor histidine kinase [Microbacterium telephonicum]|uniref:histidine kinase n=1 Tax=Microbacterium telephonicum TaxID=1714841 RepID=A0A498C018_9MICO|nr:HAMP domain-containing sensor histidine kinase [Microbacterium telephonicum]RLK49022.1 signal transduction histidine kinase [Microbacterium telephonicum]